MRRLLGFVLLAALAGCSSPRPAATAARALPLSSPAVYASVPVHALVPGVASPAVTPKTLDSTICVNGYTAKIRPPASYTNRLKALQMAPIRPGTTIKAPNGRTYAVVGFGLPGRPSDYEEDHVFSLEAGGDPYDPANLAPEPWNGPYGAHAKDRVENLVHARICARTLALADGQKILGGAWWTYR